MDDFGDARVAQQHRLIEACRLTRSKAVELRLHAQELRARSVAARERALAVRLRAMFTSILSEPMPERILKALQPE